MSSLNDSTFNLNYIELQRNLAIAKEEYGVFIKKLNFFTIIRCLDCMFRINKILHDHFFLFSDFLSFGTRDLSFWVSFQFDFYLFLFLILLFLRVISYRGEYKNT